ncbi:hypothetical protein F5Y04DRAFT_264083 [Hypomontagnella monticulosa]|nr:hypothetical protein F5Y04DRAFT_264083 [Hypomontagnella monticulosa]
MAEENYNVRDIDLSIRFKHGIHTIFLFIEPMKPFSNVAEALLKIMKERYPAGLTTSLDSLKKTELPDDASQIRFAVPREPRDLSKGWTPLDIGEQDTPASKNIEDNSIVAFTFAPQDADEDYRPEFEVHFPVFDDNDEEQ